MAVGPYRRGCAESSDVDLLLSHRDGVSHNGTSLRGSFIQQLLESLRRCGIVTRELMEERVAPKDHSLPSNQRDRWKQEGYLLSSLATHLTVITQNICSQVRYVERLFQGRTAGSTSRSSRGAI